MSEALIAFIPFVGGISSVWADEYTIYAGTTYSGVYVCSTATISGSPSLSPYKVYPDILNNQVQYLHGKGDYLCVATLSGVDRYNTDTSTRDFVELSGVTKCFQTLDGSYYYISNPDSVVSNLDDSVLTWSYVMPITLEYPAPHDDYNYLVELPRKEPYDIVSKSKPNGDDIRILTSTGALIPYYIELWDNIGNPQLWLKLPKDTSELYVLYGSYSAPAYSSAEEAFLLFDDFDEDELDTNKWSFSGGAWAPNEYVIENSVISLRSYNNSFTVKLKSVATFSGSAMEASIRVSEASDITDLDGKIGFDPDDGGVYAGMGTVDSATEKPHHLVSQTSQGTIQGSRVMSTALLDFVLIESQYYQASQYDTELLTATGTLILGYRHAFASLSNAADTPHFEIDWVRVRSFDYTPPNYTVGTSEYTYNFFPTARVYAKYGTTLSGFTYTTEPNNVLKSDYINDMYVTEDTSIYGGNVLFLATNQGAMLIEEKRGDELNCRKRVYLTQT
jgi:hypothetical protein